MFKRRLSSRMLITLGVVLLAVCATAFAGLRDGSWDVNPSAFRYDMSLYFKLADEDYEDLDKYEIGAFVAEECRGLAEKIDLPDDRSCLYMRIRSNQSADENVEFLLRNRETGDTVIVKAADGAGFTFKADSRVGLPSAPLMMARFYSVSVATEGKGTVEFTDSLYAAGSVIDLKAVPAEGYHFEGWSDGLADESRTFTVTGNEALTAKFAPNMYRLVFTIDGEEIESVEVACDAAVEAPEVPARVGYTFSGWTDLPEVMPAHDVTVSGSFTINSYRLAFRIDGQDIYSAEVEYDSPITAPDAPAKEGYSFNGWGEVPATMPAHDVEIHSTYTVNSYLLTFELDGETVFSEEVTYGSAIVAPETPAREGYTFSGWSELPATMPANDLTVVGTYDVNSYRLVFKVDGEEIFAEDVDYGTPLAAPEAPEKTGYTFNGWGELPETMPAHDIEMHSSYTINWYRLSFTLDGEEIRTDSLTYGTPIVAPEVAERIGHTFSGWGEVPETMPAADLALTGEYIVNIYNVTYKIDGEVAYHAEVPYGTAVPAFDPEDREGYTFSGWGLDIPAVMPAKDLEYNGSFIVNMFAITFRIGGQVISSDRVAFGTEIIAPEAPAREGYSFTGWKDVPATMPARDVVVDGDYSINRYKITYMVEEAEYLTQEYDFGAPIKAPEPPVQEGHSFSGWGDIPATMPAFDLVFGGTFAENFYRVTFRLDGTVLFTDDVEFGAPIAAPEVPAKEGYTFNGWGDVPSTMPAYNLEYDGSYTVNMYAVTFRIGDEVIYTGSLAYGAEVVAPEAPAKEGHSFGGWGVVPATMPASDLEVTGEYAVNSYSITYRIGEEDFFTTQLPYGAEVVAPEAPARDGYSFTGWTGVPATMPAGDVIVSGAYAADSYRLSFLIGEEVIFSGDVQYGTEIIAPEAPAKEGHTFAGWGMVPATMPASDLVLTGSYDVNLYTLTYRIDDADYFTTQIAFGSVITAPAAPEKEGYSFTGWSETPATMPSNDLVISGSYSINSYGILFRIGDEVIYEATLPYGTEILAPDAPSKEGHTFAGWGMVPATMPAHDLEFTGSYDANLYTLTFDIDGEVFFLTQLPYGAPITAPAEVPDKEGNSFGGWGMVPETMPANDLTVSGTYSANHYTVTFRIGGEILFTGEQPFGSEIIAPVAPGKEGHTFSGWGDVPATVPAENLEFIGSYAVNTYTVTFTVDNQTVTLGVPFGEPIEVPAAEEKEGHTFSGWGMVPATMPAMDLAFTGSYEVNFYSIVFRIGEETIYAAQVAYGSEIAAPEAPAREGHGFSGWGEVPSVMPAYDLAFEGSYSVLEYLLSFSIDGEVIFSGNVAYGAEVVAPEAPAKEGHTFTGWGVVPATMPAADLAVTGTYEVNSYAVVFRIGEEVVLSVQLPYGAEIAVPEAPAKEGLTFTGWGEVPAVMPAADLEFNGAYTVNSYKLVFRIGEEVISEAEVGFGAEIIAPEAPAKTGYTFAGWGIVPATMPASDLEITGAYDLNYYPVIFKINDDIVYSAQLPYGAEIVAPEAPEAEGYTFSGWSEYPATMPAEEVVVTATFSVNVYEALFRIDGEDFVTLYVAYGDSIDIPEAPEKEGYTFSGWGEVPGTMPAHNVVFDGVYDLNYYRLTVYLNDEVYIDEEVAYGAEVVVPDPEVEYGYKFDGWQEEIPATMPAHDVEIHGTVSEDATVAVEGVSAEETVTVITIDGVLIHKDVKASEIKDRLTPGIYIINGRKAIVR